METQGAMRIRAEKNVNSRPSRVPSQRISSRNLRGRKEPQPSQPFSFSGPPMSGMSCINEFIFQIGSGSGRLPPVPELKVTESVSAVAGNKWRATISGSVVPYNDRGPKRVSLNRKLYEKSARLPYLWRLTVPI